MTNEFDLPVAEQARNEARNATKDHPVWRTVPSHIRTTIIDEAVSVVEDIYCGIRSGWKEADVPLTSPLRGFPDVVVQGVRGFLAEFGQMLDKEHINDAADLITAAAFRFGDGTIRVTYSPIEKRTLEVPVRLPLDATEEDIIALVQALSDAAEPLTSYIIRYRSAQTDAAIAREEADDSRREATEFWTERHVKERIAQYRDRAKSAETRAKIAEESVAELREELNRREQ